MEAVHLDQLREHGGVPGIRDENVLESALGRPRHKWMYDAHADIPSLAAAYAYGIVTSHPYRDGNKRIGFLAMVTFLGLNGVAFRAPETDVVTTILALADNRLSEKQLAGWIREHVSDT